MSGTNWTATETMALINLARDGKSSVEIASALTGMSHRKFTSDNVRKKLNRLRAEGADIPRFEVKIGTPVRSLKPKRDKQASADRKRRKTCTIGGFQKIAMAAIKANSTYEPSPVIAGFPTIQIRKDREGNPLAPVTLRRVDLDGARA